MKHWLKVILDSLLIAGILASAFWGLHVYIDYPEYHQYAQVQTDGFENVPALVVYYNATSTAFGAGSSITFNMIALADNVAPNYTRVQPNFTTFYLEFPYSAREPKPAFGQDGALLEAYANMTWNNATREFTGSTTLSYSQPGDFCSVAVISLYVAVPSFTGLSNFCSIYPTIVIVADSTTLFQSQVARASLALTWIVLALTLVFVRDFGEKIWQDVSQFVENNKRPKSKKNA
ncbi:MAG: hypothetical protein ABSE82_00720 [Nitrososphaerales archaeon]